MGGVVAEIGVGLPQQGLQLEIGDAGAELPHRLHIALEIGFRLPQPAQPGAALPLCQHTDGAVADPQDLADQGNRAHLVDVLLPRFRHIDLPLGYQEDLLVGLHGPL